MPHKIRVFSQVFSLVLIILLLSSCAAKPVTKTVFAMDTVMRFTANGENAGAAIDAISERMFYLESRFSVTNPASELYKLNENGASSALSPELRDILTAAVGYCREFEGYFDITLKPVTELWGFYADEYRVPTDVEIADALNSTGYENVTLDRDAVTLGGVQLDLGAIAKGYAAAEAVRILDEYGIDSAIIDLGGSVTAVGVKPDGSDWSVAVTNPAEPGEYLCVLNVADTSLVTSGSYQRYFEEDGVRYHHIIDPRTGRPADTDILGITIICPDPEYADVLSTALFVMGESGAIEFWRQSREFEMIITTGSGTAITPGVAELLESNKQKFSIIS
jgi:thiamine biosynthesis lipoprotein